MRFVSLQFRTWAPYSDISPTRSSCTSPHMNAREYPVVSGIFRDMIYLMYSYRSHHYYIAPILFVRMHQGHANDLLQESRISASTYYPVTTQHQSTTVGFLSFFWLRFCCHFLTTKSNVRTTNLFFGIWLNWF